MRKPAIRTGRQVDLTGPQASWPARALRLWSEATSDVIHERDAWHPAPLQGDLRLRETLASLLSEDPENILITNGVRASASVIARTAGRVMHERPSFTGTVAVCRSFHPDLELVRWSELAAASRAGGWLDPDGVVWLTSPCRNPDGVTLSGDDWSWVIGAARKSRVVVNEIYRWFGAPSTRPDPVWMVGSLSKLAGSGAGLGWIRGQGMAAVAREQHVRPSLCWQRCWRHLLEAGALDLFVHHTVRPAAAAAEAFATELRRVSGYECAPAAGPWPPFLLLPVPACTERAFVARLEADGVRVGPGADFLAARPSVRVCFVGVRESDAQHAARVIGAHITAGGCLP